MLNMEPLPHWFFSVTGGEGTETSTFHRHLASKIALKKTRDVKTLSILSSANCHF